jgi:hypothetical protein
VGNEREGYVCLNTMDRRDQVYAHIAALPKNTRIVHIHGYPRQHILQSLIRRLTDLEEIEVTEGMKGHLSAEMFSFLLDHGIGVSVGFRNGNYPRAAQFQNRGHSQKKARFKRLTETHRARFKELIDLGIEEAIVLQRYLCLNGEDPVPMHKIPEASKYSPITAAKNISIKIRTVFKYLAPSSRSSNEVKKAAKRLKQKVEKLRKKKEEAERVRQWKQDMADRKAAKEVEEMKQKEERGRALQIAKDRKERARLHKKIIKRLKVSNLPTELPLAELQIAVTFAFYFQKKSKQFKEDFRGLPKTRAVLCLRYGLSYSSGIYRSSDEVAAMLGLTTGEVERLEENAMQIIRYAK